MCYVALAQSLWPNAYRAGLGKTIAYIIVAIGFCAMCHGHIYVSTTKLTVEIKFSWQCMAIIY